MNLDPKAFARSLDALKPESLRIYQWAIDEAEAALARALPRGTGEPGRPYTARDCLDGIRCAQGARE